MPSRWLESTQLCSTQTKCLRTFWLNSLQIRPLFWSWLSCFLLAPFQFRLLNFLAAGHSLYGQTGQLWFSLSLWGTPIIQETALSCWLPASALVQCFNLDQAHYFLRTVQRSATEKPSQLLLARWWRLLWPLPPVLQNYWRWLKVISSTFSLQTH